MVFILGVHSGPKVGLYAAAILLSKAKLLHKQHQDNGVSMSLGAPMVVFRQTQRGFTQSNKLFKCTLLSVTEQMSGVE